MNTNNKYNNKSGFKIPADFFENFENNLYHALEKQTGNKFKTEKSGFKVPDRYFENFEKEVLTKIIKKEKTVKVVTFSTRKKLLYLSAIAATVALAILLWNPNTSNNINFENLAISDIQEYLDDSTIEISNEELAVLLENDTNLLSTFEDSQVSDEILEDYLLKEDLENDIYVE